MKAKRRRKQNYRKYFLVIFLVLGIYFGRIFIDQVQEGFHIASQKEEELAKMDELNKEILLLENEYQRKDSLEFVEQVARERHGMIKANEKIIEKE